MEAFLWISLLAGGIWLVLFAASLARLARAPLIRPAEESSHGPLPAVSVIIPARNEEGNIIGCVQSLLDQDHKLIDIIVVDDNSRDATASLVESLSRQDSRVRLVRAGPLPPGWTGKCHALHAGVSRGRPRGQWLLFTDADTVHHPQSLSAALQVALDRNLDLVSLVPHLAAHTFWEKLMQPTMAALISLFHRPGPIDEKNGFANGQFILVKRDSYLRAGGHEAVRGRVLEDAELARQVVSSGGRGLLALGYELFSTRMYHDLRSIWEGWVKNIYLIMSARAGRVLGTVVLLWLLSLWPALAGWAGLGLALARSSLFPSWWCWTALGIYLMVLLFQATLRRLNRWPAAYALAAPLSGFLAILICWRSMQLYRHKRGVSWKGRLYRDGG
jgi:chlorobactene glucosyltransferase